MISFKFSDVGYDLLKESKQDHLVIVKRMLRRMPMFGMPQPTPHGGSMGFQTILNIKKYGLPFQTDFALKVNQILVQSDSTDENGDCILDVPISDAIPKIYQLVIY
jgi:hypothetical protein